MSGILSPTKSWHSSVYPSIDPTRPELSLVGKSVVVTGGGLGIGLAISRAVALAGASQLAIIGRRPDVLAKAKSEIEALAEGKTQVATFSADISKQDQINEAFKQIHSTFGRKPLDILVNNAGYFAGLHNVGQETIDYWSQVIDVNIKGLYIVTTAFLKNSRLDTTIINVSSALAHTSASVRPGAASYAATKLAGAKIMDYAQVENPSLHILNIEPGRVTETEMAAKVAKDVGHMPHVDDAELTGGFVVWAASPEAKFLKGKFVYANWDVDELKDRAKEIQDTPIFTLGLEGFSSFKYNQSH